jgi:ribosome-binding protein aMBF1 (putative translation factor)
LIHPLISKVSPTELTPKDMSAIMMAMDARALGEVIRAARIARGWSQEELARRVGVRQGHISYVERGVKTPSVGLLVRLFSELGISMDILKEAPHA